MSCLVCSRDFERSRTGRPRAFCSDRCRQEAHRLTVALEGRHETPLAAEATIATPEAARPAPPPIPSVPAGARAYCHVGPGGYGVHLSADGIHRRTLEVTFKTPRGAIEYARLLNGSTIIDGR